jgi:hypothetical protein
MSLEQMIKVGVTCARKWRRGLVRTLSCIPAVLLVSFFCELTCIINTFLLLLAQAP